MADPAMGAGPQDPAAGDSDDAAQGYVIEITVAADGTIKVGVESAGDESAEEGGSADATDTDDGAQPVKSIKEAIQIVMDIYKNSGQMSASGDDDFNSGFGQNQGSGAKGPM